MALSESKIGRRVEGKRLEGWKKKLSLNLPLFQPSSFLLLILFFLVVSEDKL
jgi:hypothetical protein